MEQKQYACIDLKSFYTSVECVDRGLDPMTTNLMVADLRRAYVHSFLSKCGLQSIAR